MKKQKLERKWKEQKMDTLEFIKQLEDLMDDGMENHINIFKNPITRHKYIIEKTPFEDMDEVRDWRQKIGLKLENQLIAERAGTPEEKVYIWTQSKYQDGRLPKQLNGLGYKELPSIYKGGELISKDGKDIFV